MIDHDIAVVGGTVVSSEGQARVNIGISDGKIAYVGTQVPSAREVVEADGLKVLPGGVDTHVHFMDPGATEREDFGMGSAAAARAGVTTVVEHTHAWPVKTPADLAEKVRLIGDRSNVDFGLGAHAWPGLVDQVAGLWEAGVSFFKVFTCTTHGVPGHDPAHLRQHLRASSDVGGLSLIHCEDESLCAVAEEELKAAGRNDNGIVPEWRNRDAEVVAAVVAGLMIQRTHARATVAHVSHPDVAKYLAAERAKGADVWAEACPQYFLLREEEVLDKGSLRKFTPPARNRSDADEAEMWQMLREGLFNYVSSDHAPSTMPQKTAGDIWNVAFGLPGIDTTFPALIEAVHAGHIGWSDVARVYAEMPARRFGYWGRKGAIRVGFHADLALIDPNGTWTLADSDIESKAQWSPYSGRQFHGRNVHTMLRGRTIFTADRGVDNQTSGRYLAGAGFKGADA